MFVVDMQYVWLLRFMIDGRQNITERNKQRKRRSNAPLLILGKGNLDRFNALAHLKFICKICSLLKISVIHIICGSKNHYKPAVSFKQLLHSDFH